MTKPGKDAGEDDATPADADPDAESAKGKGEPRKDRRETDRRAEDRRAGDDRRAGYDRRSGKDRRGKERRKDFDIEDRRPAERRINEYPLTAEELEFINAVDQYKKAYNKPFPTWSEILHIIKSIGYEKRE